MTPHKLLDCLAPAFGPAFVCFPDGIGLRVTTPLAYFTGESIDLFIRSEAGRILITDGGCANRILKAAGLTTKRVNRIIYTAANRHGMVFWKGTIIVSESGRRLNSQPDWFTARGLRLAQAASEAVLSGQMKRRSITR